MRRLWDIVLTAAITAVVTTLVNGAVADTSAVGRTWKRLQAGFFAFADGAWPVVGVLACLTALLWLVLRLALLRGKQDVELLEVDPWLPNPMTVLGFAAVLLSAAALSLARAASGSDVAAMVACCVGAVGLRSALNLIGDVRRTVFGAPF